MKRHMNKVYRGLVIFGGIAVLLGVCRGLGNTAQALTYQNEANVEFSINPTIGVSLSASGLVIDNLAPGTSADSNIITVSVNTNASHGYYLSATAGTAGGNTDLAMTNPANNNYKFTNLTGNKATLDSFEDNKWGYSYCLTTNDCTNTTNWVSGNYGSTSAGYNGLPLDNNDNGATGVALINTISPVANNSVQFKIGAKASAAQASGTYTGTVNFYAVTNRPPVYLQNLDSSSCTTTMSTAVDSRDGTEYHIQRLADGKCWLLDNLALDLTNDTILNSLSADNTNIDTTNDPDTLAALKGTSVRDPSSDANGKYATAKVSNWTTSYSYSAPLVNLTNKDRTAPDGTSSDDPMQSQATSGGWKYGGYYNYCAASAGSYCYGNGASAGTSSGNATSDICPKGWRMPTGNTSGEYKALYDNASYITYDNYRKALRLPLSGFFGSGSVYSQGSSGYFWSSTRDSNYDVRILYLGTSYVSPADSNGRSSGNSVRCVLGS